MATGTLMSYYVGTSLPQLLTILSAHTGTFVNWFFKKFPKAHKLPKVYQTINTANRYSSVGTNCIPDVLTKKFYRNF